jgi:hypothetical protein
VRSHTDAAPTFVATFGSYNVVSQKSAEKRIMLKKFLLFTIASLVMLPALADKPTDKGNKGGGAVPLCVTFDDGIAYSFVSDGFDEYCDGHEGVTTQIGKFRFGLNVGLNSPTRNFRLDLQDCLTTPLVCELTSIYFKGWNVFSASPDGAEYLNMAVGDEQPVNFQLDFFDGQDDAWRIQFNPSKCPSGHPASTMAKVTKTNEGWTFEADENAVACLYFLEGPRKFHTFNGLYHVPFLIEAAAK